MRDYQHIELYLNILAADIYPQPADPGHQGMLENICGKWLPVLYSGCRLRPGPSIPSPATIRRARRGSYPGVRC
jgi:hypothetical protein